jgi:hypothetical protein
MGILRASGGEFGTAHPHRNQQIRTRFWIQGMQGRDDCSCQSLAIYRALDLGLLGFNLVIHTLKHLRLICTKRMSFHHRSSRK